MKNSLSSVSLAVGADELYGPLLNQSPTSNCQFPLRLDKCLMWVLGAAAHTFLRLLCQALLICYGVHLE